MKKSNSIFSKSSQKDYSILLSETTLPYDDFNNWDNRLCELNKYVKELHPHKLFRFRRFSENSINELKNGKIFLPTPSEFNDYYDTYINFDKNSLIEYISEAVSPKNMAHFLSSDEHSNNLLPAEICGQIAKAGADMDMELYATKLYPEYLELVKENTDKIVSVIKHTLVCTCFSEDILSTYMWGLYAEDNKGFAIEYDIDEHVFGIRKFFVDQKHYGFFSLLPVIYSDLNPNSNTYANQLLLGLCAPDLVQYFMTADYLWKTKIALYKSKKWDKEKEWRIISTFEDIKDYDSINDLHAIFPYPPKAVYMGIAMKPENKMEIIKISKEKGIKAYDIITDSPEKFTFNYKEINISESLNQNKIKYN